MKEMENTKINEKNSELISTKSKKENPINSFTDLSFLKSM